MAAADISHTQALDYIAHHVRELGSDLPSPACVGVAVSAHIDHAGTVTSCEYGWEGVDIAEELSLRLGYGIHVGSGAAAMAAQALLSAPLSDEDLGSMLYFYAREVVNHAWIVNGAVYRPHSGATTAAFHDLARGSELEHDGVHPLSGQATVAAAQKAGIKVHSYRDLVQIASTNATARKLVDALTLVLDVVDPV